MPKITVALCEIPEFKLTVDLKSLVWYRSPVNSSSIGRISLFGKDVNLGFGNSNSGKAKLVEYQIPDKETLHIFYQKPICIQIIDNQ